MHRRCQQDNTTTFRCTNPQDTLHYIINCIQWAQVPSVLCRCWLGGRKGIRPVKTDWWGAGMVICLERGADLHMAQLMPLPLTVTCFSKIQIGLTFLVPAYLGSPGQRAVKRGCVCVCNYDTIFYRWSYYCSETMHVERPACCHDATCCSSLLASFKHALKGRKTGVCVCVQWPKQGNRKVHCMANDRDTHTHTPI